MTRSHGPSLLRLVERCVLGECGWREEPVAVAVSGGPDSMALLDVLAQLRRRLELELLAISIDHGLRPEAGRELQLVREHCQKLGVAFRSAQLGLQDGANLQERAREARRDAIVRIAGEELGESSLLATAHHREDRAETVLLRMVRGTSLEGLAVLPPRDGRRIRPLIRASRSDVMLYLERRSVPFALDPSNRQLRFLRVQVREQVLPLLESLGPGIVAHLNQLADEASELERPLGLNREQRNQLRRALADPRMAIDLPLPGGLRLRRERG